MTASRITDVRARRVWDSRGRPTVEAEVTLAGGARGRAIAPAGASRGSREAVDLRDGGAALGGFDVRLALDHVNGEIARAVTGLDAAHQEEIDACLCTLDPTPTFSRLGGNATIAVSLAVLQAAAAAARLPLYAWIAHGRPVRIPLPEIQIFGGGAHAGRRIDIQDLMIMALRAESFDRALEMTAEVYRNAGEILAARGRLAGVADEGGFWPTFDSNEQALDTLVEAIERAGFRPGEEVGISLDIAASEFGRCGRYRLGLAAQDYDSASFGDLLLGWCRRYPIVSVEDPLAEDDLPGMVRFTEAVGAEVQVIGDDLLVTNATLVQEAATARACNAVLIKPNQAGTVSATLAALRAGKAAGFGTIVSARSGETEDVSIAHLAVGWDAGQLKVGSFARGERMAKWNEVLRIEQDLGTSAVFAGASALSRSRACVTPSDIGLAPRAP